MKSNKGCDKIMRRCVKSVQVKIVDARNSITVYLNSMKNNYPRREKYLEELRILESAYNLICTIDEIKNKGD